GGVAYVGRNLFRRVLVGLKPDLRKKGRSISPLFFARSADSARALLSALAGLPRRLALRRDLLRRLALRARLLRAAFGEGDRFAAFSGFHDGVLRQALLEHFHQVDDLSAAGFRLGFLESRLLDDVVAFLLLAARERLQRFGFAIFELGDVQALLRQRVDLS